MDVEPTKDKPLDSSESSFLAHQSVEAAKVPPPPTQDVLPKATDVALSLMKPASTLTQATQALGGRPKPGPLGKGSRLLMGLGLAGLASRRR